MVLKGSSSAQGILGILGRVTNAFWVLSDKTGLDVEGGGCEYFQTGCRSLARSLCLPL